MASNPEDQVKTLQDLIAERERILATRGTPCVSGVECGSGFGCLGGECRQLEGNKQSGLPQGCGDLDAVDPTDEEYDVSIFDPRVPDTWPDPNDAAGCCPGFNIDNKSTWPYDPADPTTWPGYSEEGEFVDPAETAGGCTPADAAVALPAPPWGDFGYQLSGGCGEPGCGSLASYGDDFVQQWVDPAQANGFDPYDPGTWPDDNSIDPSNPSTWPQEWKDVLPNAKNDYVPGLTQVNACGDYICDHLGCRPGKAPGRIGGGYDGSVCCNEQGCAAGACDTYDPSSTDITQFQVQCADGKCVAESAQSNTDTATGNIDSLDLLESNYDLSKNKGWTNASFSVEPANIFAVSELGDIFLVTSADLDYNIAKSIEVAVTATDNDNQAYTSNFSVNILNSNTNPVLFDISTPSGLTVSEDAPVGTVIYQFSASDGDSDTNVYFSLARSAHGRFSIDQTSGELKLAKVIDAEVRRYWTLTVVATSSDGSVAVQDVALEVIDINDNPIIYLDVDTSANFCRVTSEPGDTVGITIEAFDLDISVQDNVTYSLANNGGNRFKIDPSTGVVTVNAFFNETLQNLYPDLSLPLVPTLEPIDLSISILATSPDGSLVTILKEIQILADGDEEPEPEPELTPCPANSYRDMVTLGCNCRPGYTFFDCDPDDEFDCVLQEDIEEQRNELGEITQEFVPAGTRIPDPGCYLNDDAKDELMPYIPALPDSSVSPSQSMFPKGGAQTSGKEIVNINPVYPSVLEDADNFTYTGITVRLLDHDLDLEEDWCCKVDGCYKGECGSEGGGASLCCNKEGSCWSGTCAKTNRPHNFCVTRSGTVEGPCEQLKAGEDEYNGLEYYDSPIRIMDASTGTSSQGQGLKFENQPIFGPLGGPVYNGFACNTNTCNKSAAGRTNGFCCDEYGCTAGGCGITGRYEPVCFSSSGIDLGVCGETASVNTYYPTKVYCDGNAPEGSGSSEGCYRAFSNTGEPMHHRARTDNSDDKTQWICYTASSATQGCVKVDIDNPDWVENFDPQGFLNQLVNQAYLELSCDEGGCVLGWTDRFSDFFQEVSPKGEPDEDGNPGEPLLSLPEEQDTAQGYFGGPYGLVATQYETEFVQWKEDDAYDICCDKEGCKSGPCEPTAGNSELCCDGDSGECREGPCNKPECTDFCQSAYEEDGTVPEECYYGDETLYCENQCDTCDDAFRKCYPRYNRSLPLDDDDQPPCSCIPGADFPDCWKCGRDGVAALDCDGCELCQEIENFDCGCGGPRTNFTFCYTPCDLEEDGGITELLELQAKEACKEACKEIEEATGLIVEPLSTAQNPACGQRPGCSMIKYYPGSAIADPTFTIEGASREFFGVGEPGGEHASELYVKTFINFESVQEYELRVKGSSAEGTAEANMKVYIVNRNTRPLDWTVINNTTPGGNSWTRESQDDSVWPVPNDGIQIGIDPDNLPYDAGIRIQPVDEDFGTTINTIIDIDDEDVFRINPDPFSEDATISIVAGLDPRAYLVYVSRALATSSDGESAYIYFSADVEQPAEEDKAVNFSNLDTAVPTIVKDGPGSLYIGLKAYALGNYYFSFPKSWQIVDSTLAGFSIDSTNGEVSWTGDSSILSGGTIETITVEVTMNDDFVDTYEYNVVVAASDPTYEPPTPPDNAEPPKPQHATWFSDFSDWRCDDDYKQVTYRGRNICVPVIEDDPEFDPAVDGESAQPEDRPLVPYEHVEGGTAGLRVIPGATAQSVAYVNENMPGDENNLPPRRYTGYYYAMESIATSGGINLELLPECPADQKCTVVETGSDTKGDFAIRKECPRETEPQECACQVQCSCHLDCPSCHICDQGECVKPPEASGQCCPCETTTVTYRIQVTKKTSEKTSCDGGVVEGEKEETLTPFDITLAPGSKGVDPLSVVDSFDDVVTEYSCTYLFTNEETKPVFSLSYTDCEGERTDYTPPEALMPSGGRKAFLNYTETYSAELFKEVGSPDNPDFSC